MLGGESNRYRDTYVLMPLLLPLCGLVRLSISCRRRVSCLVTPCVWASYCHAPMLRAYGRDQVSIYHKHTIMRLSCRKIMMVVAKYRGATWRVALLGENLGLGHSYIYRNY